MKRFHQQGSWTLNQRELRSFLSTVDKAYSRRIRQLRAFFAAPANKPIGRTEKIICTGMVALHCLKVSGQVLALKDVRAARQSRAWRQEGSTPRPMSSPAAVSLINWVANVSFPAH